jgi:hypothetical protein
VVIVKEMKNKMASNKPSTSGSRGPLSFIEWLAILIYGLLILAFAAYILYEQFAPYRPATVPSTVTTPAGTPITVVPTNQGSGTGSEFVDQQGTYTLSYPSVWVSQDAGNQAHQWILPEGVVMSIHAEPAQPGDTLESYAQEVVTRLPYDVLSQTSAQVSGKPAIRQEVAYPGQTQLVAVGYLVLHGGQKYQIALSGLDTITAEDQTRVIQQFEQVLSSFNFQP